MFSKEKLVFDPAAAAETDNVGAYLRASDGTLLTHTDVAGKKSLDVNVANEVDIRNLSAAQDNVAINGISAGGNSLVINADGSLNVNADISVTTGSDKLEDSAHASGDVGTYVLAVRQNTLAASTDLDGDYASFKVAATGALWVKHDGQVDVPVPTHQAWLVTQNTVGTISELVVASGLSGRRKILIQNASTGGNSVYLAQANTVTAGTGIRLSPGSAIELELSAGAAIYAVATTTGADLRVAEFANVP